MSIQTSDVRSGSHDEKVAVEYGVHIRYRKPRGGERPADKIVVESEDQARGRVRGIQDIMSNPQKWGRDVISASLVTRTKTVVTTTTSWEEVLTGN
ncbi:hypothetical protein [Curtobacterium sp. MCLR17_034]|uniref:hypothetical protein n=1 Tax=Curtobacterium sp. MCLR17_034 TaxID=2175623 RepID=UPI0011B43330|nr:hypothetical protein [Curtobacterium sp. MCLR17_034]